MKHSKLYEQHNHSLKSGPGGYDCPCCNPFSCHPRNMKKMVRRIFRRTAKHRLKVRLMV